MITCITCTHNSKNIVGERAGISPICNVPDDYTICKSYQPVAGNAPFQEAPVPDEERVTVCNVEGFSEIQNSTVTVSEEEFTAAMEEQVGGELENVSSRPERRGKKRKKKDTLPEDEGELSVSHFYGGPDS